MSTSVGRDRAALPRRRATVTAPSSRAADPVPALRLRSAPAVWAAIGVATVVALALRLPGLMASLPVTGPDEGTVTGRAMRALSGQLMPDAFDWPPGSSYLLAVVVGGLRLVGVDVPIEHLELVRVGRFLFVGIAVALVVLVGAGAAASARTARPWAALTAGLMLAVSFTSVRLSRTVHPEHLQALLVLAAVLACRRSMAVRDSGWWLVAAGLLGGFAGATKYLGITVVALPVVLGLTRRRYMVAAASAAAGVAGFVVATAGTTLSRAFLDGFSAQVLHQADGHLGYDIAGPGWFFQLGTSLPGNWGVVATVAGVVGVAWFLASGEAWRRWTGVYTLALFGVIGLSRVAFPHYALILLPLLALQAGVAVVELPARVPALRGRPLAAVAGALVLMLALVPAALNVVRLLRADGAPSTEDAAAAYASTLDAPLWTEAYTGVAEPQRQLFSVADAPDEVLACGCVVALSGFQQERYLDSAEAYPAEVAAYERILAAGTILRTVSPDVPLTHRWRSLPQWGVGRVPLTGPIPTLGPTVTFLDLRSAR